MAARVAIGNEELPKRSCRALANGVSLRSVGRCALVLDKRAASDERGEVAVRVRAVSDELRECRGAHLQRPRRKRRVWKQRAGLGSRHDGCRVKGALAARRSSLRAMANAT